MTLTLGLAWWPSDPYEDLSEQRVRDVFAHLRTITLPIMRKGERRIRTVVGSDEPIDIGHLTVRRLAGRRPGQIDALHLISLSAGRPLETNARFLIGRRDHHGHAEP